MSKNILLNKKPFGRFVVSQKVFLSILKWDYVRIKKRISNLVKTMDLKDFNRIHGLDWTSSDLFFTEKVEDYHFHAALPIARLRETVYFFYDSVETKGLTNTRTDYMLLKLFKRVGSDFDTDQLECVMMTVPFLEGLKIERDEDGVEIVRYGK